MQAASRQLDPSIVSCRVTDYHVFRFQALAPLQLPVDQSRTAPPLMGFVPNQAPGAPVSPIPVKISPLSCRNRLISHEQQAST